MALRGPFQLNLSYDSGQLDMLWSPYSSCSLLRALSHWAGDKYGLEDDSSPACGVPFPAGSMSCLHGASA